MKTFLTNIGHINRNMIKYSGKYFRKKPNHVAPNKKIFDIDQEIEFITQSISDHPSISCIKLNRQFSFSFMVMKST